MLSALDAAAVRRWCETGLAALRRHQREIDELNVFPVPDGDTGTNMVLTFTSAYEAVLADADADADANTGQYVGIDSADHGEQTACAPVGGIGQAGGTETEVARLRRVLRCMARGALLGARGSSGVILSQLLAGLADALAAAPEVRGAEVAAALEKAAEASWAAVAAPVEGTVLSVATAAADAAKRALSEGARQVGLPEDARQVGLVEVCRAAAKGAAEALARTPSQLEVLARAGVVDAGGRGLVVLLDALVGVVTGTVPATAPLARMAADPRLMLVEREAGGLEYAYEVQYLLVADQLAVDELRDKLAGLGDALVIVGAGDDEPDGAAGTRVHNVHVHVNDIGAAIEAGIEAGRPYRISVVRFADNVSGRVATDLTTPSRVPAGTGESATPSAVAAWTPGTPQEPQEFEESEESEESRESESWGDRIARPVRTRAVVVVAFGPGLVQLFETEGAVVVASRAGRDQVAAPVAPSVAEVLDSIMAADADSVVVLPNDSATHAVADRAAERARAAGRIVAVIPTRSPVQALAAIAVADGSRRFDDDVIAMADAAGSTRWAQVTVAIRDALTSAGRCRSGDVLGMVEGEVVIVGGPAPEHLVPIAAALLDRLLGGGGELVTMIVGAGVPDELAEQLTEHLAVAWPLVETTVYQGGQPHHALLLGVE